MGGLYGVGKLYLSNTVPLHYQKQSMLLYKQCLTFSFIHSKSSRIWTHYLKDCTTRILHSKHTDQDPNNPACYCYAWLFCDSTDCDPPGSSNHVISHGRTWEWVAISFSRDLPDSGIKPTSPALAGGFFTTWATRKAIIQHTPYLFQAQISIHADDPLTTILSSLPNQTLTVILNFLIF